MDGTPRAIFSQVEALKNAALTVPQTIAVLYELNQTGADLPIDALTVSECADRLEAYLTAQA
jgi:energy-coupling factor transport system ATP-binding protein